NIKRRIRSMPWFKSFRHAQTLQGRHLREQHCTASQHEQPYCGLMVRFTTKCAGTYSSTSFTSSWL
ncbi:hypothetical protein TJ55_01540, partial [Salmonella enterica subsp. enterica serovar Kentucky]